MTEHANLVEVTPAEAGQKLLQLLARRLGLPAALLHRWIRSGQVRRNGKRTKPFERVQARDVLRLPPFAAHVAASEARLPAPPTPLPPLPLLHRDAELLVCNKPAGLPVHGGSGHRDSLVARVAAHFAGAAFAPTPAHRLDRDTSGLLLLAASYRMLRALQDALRAHALHKEYVAWLEGMWGGKDGLHAPPRLLRHILGKQYTGPDELVRVQANGSTGRGIREARCIVGALRCLPPDPAHPRGRTLAHIRLLTGRTHQIRAQLAAEGCPVCGDGKYGTGGGPLRLHALRLILPPDMDARLTTAGLGDAPLAPAPARGLWDNREFVALPPWQGEEALVCAPLPLSGPLAGMDAPC